MEGEKGSNDLDGSPTSLLMALRFTELEPLISHDPSAEIGPRRLQ